MSRAALGWAELLNRRALVELKIIQLQRAVRQSSVKCGLAAVLATLVWSSANAQDSKSVGRHIDIVTPCAQTRTIGWIASGWREDLRVG